jgi:hypothetical protein
MTQIGSTDLGKYLKIVSVGAVYNTLSDESAMWEMMFRELKKDVEQGRELRYTMRKSYGAAASQFVSNGSAGAFPSGQASEMSEAVANYKDHSLTLELPLSVIRLAEKDLGRYGAPIAEEVTAKGIAHARNLSQSLFQDGTGIIGEVASVTAAGNSAVVVLKATNTARGFIGWFNEGDKLKIARDNSGEEAATVNGTTAVAYWKVVDINRATNTVKLDAYSSSDVKINVATFSSTSLKADDLIRRAGTSWVNPASISDYGTVSEIWAGLETLGHDDGRTVHGIALSGALKGTRYDCSAGALDIQDLQKALSQVKTRVGQRRYSFPKAFMAPEVYDALIESRETNRQFTSSSDNASGTASLKYIHRKDAVEFETDEFCRKDRIIVPPKGGDVLNFYGSDFEFVRPGGGSEWSLKVGASGARMREQQAFMEGSGVFFCKHAAALLTLHNFTI